VFVYVEALIHIQFPSLSQEKPLAAVYTKIAANVWHGNGQRTVPVHCQSVYGAHGEQAEAAEIDQNRHIFSIFKMW
jgi:hypothetical protein